MIELWRGACSHNFYDSCTKRRQKLNKSYTFMAWLGRFLQLIQIVTPHLPLWVQVGGKVGERKGGDRVRRERRGVGGRWRGEGQWRERREQRRGRGSEDMEKGKEGGRRGSRKPDIKWLTCGVSQESIVECISAELQKNVLRILLKYLQSLKIMNWIRAWLNHMWWSNFHYESRNLLFLRFMQSAVNG